MSKFLSTLLIAILLTLDSRDQHQEPKSSLNAFRERNPRENLISNATIQCKPLKNQKVPTFLTLLESIQGSKQTFKKTYRVVWHLHDRPKRKSLTLKFPELKPTWLTKSIHPYFSIDSCGIKLTDKNPEALKLATILPAMPFKLSNGKKKLFALDENIYGQFLTYAWQQKQTIEVIKKSSLHPKSNFEILKSLSSIHLEKSPTALLPWKQIKIHEHYRLPKSQFSQKAIIEIHAEWNLKPQTKPKLTQQVKAAQKIQASSTLLSKVDWHEKDPWDAISQWKRLLKTYDFSPSELKTAFTNFSSLQKQGFCHALSNTRCPNCEQTALNFAQDELSCLQTIGLSNLATPKKATFLLSECLHNQNPQRQMLACLSLGRWREQKQLPEEIRSPAAQAIIENLSQSRDQAVIAANLYAAGAIQDKSTRAAVNKHINSEISFIRQKALFAQIRITPEIWGQTIKELKEQSQWEDLKKILEEATGKKDFSQKLDHELIRSLYKAEKLQKTLIHYLGQHPDYAKHSKEILGEIGQKETNPHLLHLLGKYLPAASL